ncbi:serine hydrolase domain-containing protein [Actinoplanes sp. NPDC049265]|uniref:serine hydrolase domain-containing protein n=1 Tax=Actinoplanes sp. NPDC049265 TaxID=3363902 RepID=UPI0037185B02
MIELAGYGPEEPVVVGVRQGDGPPEFVSHAPLTADTIVYIASLGKQITAACAAMLVRDGRLDVDSTLARWMPELPGWAGRVRVRHLIHHTGGLPDVADFYELQRQGLDHTTDRVVAALAHSEHLIATPGTEHRYCNAGYVCLAVVVERASGRPLPEFAREHLFEPLGMAGTCFWPGPAAHPPEAYPLDPQHPAPLSLGDGGVWSTAADLLRWNQAAVDLLHANQAGDQAAVALGGTKGLTAQGYHWRGPDAAQGYHWREMHTAGRLDDGTDLDYGWGVGLRATPAGVRVYRHGGSWAGLTAQLVRIPERRAHFVVLALDNDGARTNALTDTLIGELTR